jgi:hypothetical protein
MNFQLHSTAPPATVRVLRSRLDLPQTGAVRSTDPRIPRPAYIRLRPGELERLAADAEAKASCHLHVNGTRTQVGGQRTGNATLVSR